MTGMRSGEDIAYFSIALNSVRKEATRLDDEIRRGLVTKTEAKSRMRDMKAAIASVIRSA